MISFLLRTADTYSLLAPPVGVESPLEGVGHVVGVLDVDRLAAAVEVPPAEPHGLGLGLGIGKFYFTTGLPVN